MKLSNQYRIARMATLKLSPGYSWVGSRRLVAINEAIYKQTMKRFDRRALPFTDLFGANITRIIIPYENEKKQEITKVLVAAGYDRIDWETGDAIKVFQPSAKAPAGTLPSERRTKIGKAIGRLPNSESWLEWWSKNLEALQSSDEYSIVISRHPVDVIRMSDHKDIESCHTPGESHWDSCVMEMKHGGLVAYMVKTEDLQNLPVEQITGKQEIFQDNARNIKGIEPESRLRLRRFTHLKDGFDLAIPEIEIYGLEDAAFQAQVEKWAHESQADIVDQQRWRAKDFARRGGKYTDTYDGTLFNNFYKDTLDYGRTQHGIPGVEDAPDPDEEIQRKRNQMSETHARYRRQFDHCVTSWGEYEVDPHLYGANEENYNINFTWGAKVTVSLPQGMFTATETLWDAQDEIDAGGDSLNSYLNSHGFLTGIRGGVNDIDFYNGGVSFEIEITGSEEGEGGVPYGYEEFCRGLLANWDQPYGQLQKVVFQWLMERGFVHPSPVRQFEKSNPQFEHFRVTVKNGEMEAVAQALLGIYDPGFWNEYVFNEKVNTAIRNQVSKELKRIVLDRRYPPRYLPGMQPQVSYPIKDSYAYDLSNFDSLVGITKERNPKITLKIIFRAGDLFSQKRMEEIIELMKIVDKLFPHIVEECSWIIENYHKEQMDFHRDLSDLLGI